MDDQRTFNEIVSYRANPHYIIGNLVVGGKRIIPEPKDNKNLEKTVVYSELSENEKFIIHYYGKVGHTILETLMPLAYAIKIKPKSRFIIDIFEYNSLKETGETYNLSSQQSNYSQTYFDFMIDMLKFYNINYELVSANHSNQEFIKLDNFYHFKHSAVRSSTIDAFMQVLDEMYPDRHKVKPFRNVYLSRKKTFIPGLNSLPTDELKNNIDKYYIRVDNETKLEDFLTQNGFEILCPEDFATFEEQITFMSSVKNLLSVSSSGLNNMLFMQPEQTVIELHTTMPLANPFNPEETLHDHYHALGYYKKLIYIALPLVSKSADWIIDKIKTNKYLREMLND